jgi:monovalent cation:H+ antiporter-2, CPA2 family
MHHETALIATLAVAFLLAFALGFLVIRVRLPPLVGYLLAGALIGPFTPGFFADTTLAPQLAEIGVILLMFGVGLHFSIPDLMAVRKIALPGAIAQTLTATAIGAILAYSWGWELAAAVVFGLSVASTVADRQGAAVRVGANCIPCGPRSIPARDALVSPSRRAH